MTESTPMPAQPADQPTDPVAVRPGGFVVTDRPEAHRFEMHRDGELVGFADYRVRGTTLSVPHVETLRPHRGQGFGATLMDGLLEIIRNDGRHIQPICPFAAAHIAQDPAHHDLLA